MKIKEFFQNKGEYTMRNLTVFITIIAATVVVLWLAFTTNNQGETRLSSEIFMFYLLAGGGVYSFGKWQDDKTRRTEIDAAAPVVPASMTNNTTVNQPGVTNVAT